MKAIITGFEPIWGIKKTPSGDLAKMWKDKLVSVQGVDVKAFVLPQLFTKSTEMLISEINAFNPDFVLMYGATKKNNPVRFERFAVNVELSPMGDNSKIPVKERPIVIDGPGGYSTNLPVDYLVDSVGKSGVDAKTSQFAGTHVCNSIFYGIMHHINTNNLPTLAGFIHMSFPNEYGVVEDGMWSTATFADLVKASVVTVDAMNKFISNRAK